ncbi:ATP-binding protein [Pseudalkalibacillus hwajinpoensis]|uniref:PAS domain-containing protein n=1 Tax=Guptibacillus hwajinpoensis TaxID=208199 RepID=UPI00325C275F
MENKREEKKMFSMNGNSSDQETRELRREHSEITDKQDIFNHSRDGMTLANQLGQVVEVNQACCEIFEMDRIQLKNKVVGHHVAPEGRDAFKQMMMELEEKGYVVAQLPVILEKGKRKVIELSITLRAYNNLNLSIIRDVTLERMLLDELMENKEKFRNILEYALDGILIWNAERMIVDANPAACELFNLNRKDIRSHNLFDFLEGQNISIGMSFQSELEKNGELRRDIQFTMPGGVNKHLEFTSKKSIHADLYLTIYRDITHTKKMILELKESEEQFRNLFERALDGMAILSESGHVVNVNCAFCRMFDQNYQSIVQTHYSEVESDCEIIWDNPAKNGRSGEGKRFNPKTKQTETFSFTLSYNIYPGHHLVIVRDMTDIKEAEENLHKTETSNVLGELAAGVAHEIRNPLSTIKGFLQLLDGNKSVNDELLKVVLDEMGQVEEIVNEFLLLSKREFTSYESIYLNELLKQVVERFSPLAAETGINIIEVYGRTGIECVGIRSHIKQVLSNIIENGIKAMPGGGKLRITLSKEHEKSILIVVEDEGNGIPDHLIHRLGEPYYQTSEQGTGLGLMVSYKVVKEHGGQINVSSVRGSGTTFKITLPVDPTLKGQ